MPRTTQEILDQAAELAARFEDHDPDEADVQDASSLRAVRLAFQSRADAERRLADAVSGARVDGHSWAAIGAMVGTSGEAARQRYGQPATKRRTRELRECEPVRRDRFPVGAVTDESVDSASTGEGGDRWTRPRH